MVDEYVLEVGDVEVVEDCVVPVDVVAGVVMTDTVVVAGVDDDIDDGIMTVETVVVLLTIIAVSKGFCCFRFDSQTKHMFMSCFLFS